MCIQKLSEKAAAYKRGGQAMLDTLAKIGDVIDKHRPRNFNFSNGPVAFRCNVASSNVGYYGPSLCYIQKGYDPPYRPTPEVWDRAGDWFYLHDDFNTRLRYAHRDEIKTIAEHIPKFLSAMLEHFDEQTKAYAEITETLTKMLSAVEQPE